MNMLRFIPLSLISVAVLSACSSVPPNNAALDQARSDYNAAQANPAARELAGTELQQAGEALNRANEAWSRGDERGSVDHLAYLTRQRVAITQETASQKYAERVSVEANAARDKIRLQARTYEADSATRSADLARAQADASMRQADASQQMTDAMRAQNLAMAAQISELNAKQTPRGLVITLGDVLFDTDQAQLKSGSLRSMDKLVGFLKQYPQRRALIEGFTDSTGSSAHNMDLSGQRAEAVRSALLDMGVGTERISTHAYGEAYPVAGNDNAAGRQLNRRVEIILSDDKGVIAQRP
jgi:outer membrane protein OmpA-like peptidoglycan-associated protein